MPKAWAARERGARRKGDDDTIFFGAAGARPLDGGASLDASGAGGRTRRGNALPARDRRGTPKRHDRPRERRKGGAGPHRRDSRPRHGPRERRARAAGPAPPRQPNNEGGEDPTNGGARGTRGRSGGAAGRKAPEERGGRSGGRAPARSGTRGAEKGARRAGRRDAPEAAPRDAHQGAPPAEQTFMPAGAARYVAKLTSTREGQGV